MKHILNIIKEHFFFIFVKKSMNIFYLIILMFFNSFVFGQDTVYVNNINYKFHTFECEKVTKKHFAVSIENAIDNNYNACSICRPFKNVNDSINLLSMGSNDSTNSPLEYQGVIYLDSTYSSEMLFNSVKTWLSYYFVDSKAVIDLEDIKNNIIVGKGKMKYYGVGVCYAGYINFTIKFYFKNGRFKFVLSNFFHENEKTGTECNWRNGFGLIYKNQTYNGPKTSWQSLEKRDQENYIEIHNMIKLNFQRIEESLKKTITKEATFIKDDW